MGEIYDQLRKAIEASNKSRYRLWQETGTQWRLIFALSRYGGLRCPSEHLALRWEDIEWDRGRMLVRSSKTEHHEGGESREIPLFAELLPFLRDAFEEAEAGTVYAITIDMVFPVAKPMGKTTLD